MQGPCRGAIKPACAELKQVRLASRASRDAWIGAATQPHVASRRHSSRSELQALRPKRRSSPGGLTAEALDAQAACPACDSVIDAEQDDALSRTRSAGRSGCAATLGPSRVRPAAGPAEALLARARHGPCCPSMRAPQRPAHIEACEGGTASGLERGTGLSRTGPRRFDMVS